MKFLPDCQWSVALQRFSQTRVWLSVEKLQPCEEVNGKPSEMFILSMSGIHYISICVNLMTELLNLQLHGRKQHIRALLIDRVMLQHEVRAELLIELYLYLFFIYFIILWWILSLAQKANNEGLSVQEYPPGSNERSVKAFHKHLQSSKLFWFIFVAHPQIRLSNK